MSDGERWQRAKAYIEQQIEAHQLALDVGGIDLTAYYTHAVKRDMYKQILEAAENNVPTKP